MPEWLKSAFKSDAELPFDLLALRLALSFALGCVVAGVYRLTHGKRNGQSSALLATLVLLTILIGMVTLVISNSANSVALAFSLVGALAIVRFRTVVEDTRDTAFVIFAVAVGMAAGTGHERVALVGIPFVAAAAFLFRPRDAASLPPSPDFTLSVRLGVGLQADDILREPFRKHLERSRLLALATARQGAALDLTYSVRLLREEGALGLVNELQGIEGIQTVELRRA